MPNPNDELDGFVQDIGFEVPIGAMPDQKRRFTTFNELSTFFQAELSKWEGIQAPNPQISILNEIVQNLEQAARHRHDAARERLLAAKNTLARKAHGIIFSESSRGRFIFSLENRLPPGAEAGALGFMLGMQVPNPASTGYFAGMVAAMLHENPSLISDDLKSRSDIARANLDTSTALINQALASLEKIDEQFGESTSASRDEHKKLLEANTERFEQIAKQIDDDAKAQIAGNEQAFNNMATTFREVMRLKKPAEYWAELKQQYEERATRSYWIAGGIALGIAIIVGFVAYSPPSAWSAKELTPESIKVSLLIFAALSPMLYLVSHFIRLATSASHLAVDAAERHQLTHVYLALSNEMELKESERAIVYQALFSRADSGLLKHDASPTMPSSLSAIKDLVK